MLPNDNAALFARSLREYASLGWKVIPVVVYQAYDKDGKLKREKAPLVDWKAYQNRFPTEDELERWSAAPFASFAGIELVTGLYPDGTVVCGIDFDQRDGKPDFSAFVDDVSSVMHTRTASGGYHYYFRHDAPLQNATNIFDGDKSSSDTIVDFRGDGGVIVVGPTPLWSMDPRSFPIAECEVVSRYETPEILSPSDLSPIPASFLVALSTRSSVGEKKWKQLFSEEAKKAPRHDILMSLVGRLLAGVSDPEHVAGARKIVGAIAATQFGDRFDSAEGQNEIDRMFDYSVAQAKKKRTPEYMVAADAIRDAQSAPLVEQWTRGFRPVRAELRDDLVSYFDGAGLKMDILAKDRLSIAVFRNLHHLAYGVMLPVIPKKHFESFVVSVPISRVADQSVTLEEILSDILSELSLATPPLESEKSAARVASKRLCATYLDESGARVVLFRLRALVPRLRDEGIRPNRSDITAALRAVDAQVVRQSDCNLWKYVSDPVEDDRSREAV